MPNKTVKLKKHLDIYVTALHNIVIVEMIRDYVTKRVEHRAHVFGDV